VIASHCDALGHQVQQGGRVDHEPRHAAAR
jgi:hypothetical protein